MALLFVACKDKYDVNLDELYGTTSGSSSKVDKEIITCGDSKVMIINIGKASMTTVPYEWEWDSKTANDLSVTLKGRLLGMDECKVVNEGNDQLVLLTSSGGSALILSRKTKNVYSLLWMLQEHTLLNCCPTIESLWPSLVTQAAFRYMTETLPIKLSLKKIKRRTWCHLDGKSATFICIRI